MELKTIPESIDNLIRDHVKQDPEIIGTFAEIINIWSFLFPPKQAIVLVGEEEIILIKLSYFNLKPIKIEKYDYPKIRKIAIINESKASILSIQLKNKKKIKLQIHRKNIGLAIIKKIVLFNSNV